MKIVLTIIIAFMQAAIAIIPSKGKLFDNRFNFPKNIKGLGATLIACCFFTVALTVWLFLLAEGEEKENRNSLAEQLHSRDSLHEYREDSIIHFYSLRVDSSYSKSIQATNEALEKYNLEIQDSLQNVVRKNIPAPIPTPDPLIMVASPVRGAKGSSIWTDTVDYHLRLHIRFKTYYNTAFNFKFTIFILRKPLESGETKMLYRYSTPAGPPVVPEIDRTSEFDVPNSLTSEGKTIIVLIGSYSRDRSNSQPIPFSEAELFDFSTNSYGGRTHADSSLMIQLKKFK